MIENMLRMLAAYNALFMVCISHCSMNALAALSRNGNEVKQSLNTLAC